ncbi:MAG: site-specific integrase [Anaerolineae bacterium]|nr:site-specific integrase [Caldilineaceae bacterium]MCB0255737.1 site-specific integrase [Anaerolineae bacterium]
MTGRNVRAGIDDRWHKRVKGPGGQMHTVKSALYGKVTRWRVRWVDDSGSEKTRVFDRKADAQAYLNKLTADVQRGDYIDPNKSNETFDTVAEQWYTTKAHRKPKTLAGYRSLLDTIVLPKWADVPLNKIDHQAYTTWLGSLSVDGSQRGTALSASRITQAHQLVGAVLKYAQKSGKLSKNVALELERSRDLPQPVERERRYLTHEELLKLAKATGRFETLTLVLGYCGLRFGEAAALRRKHVGDRELTITASATHVTGRGIVESTTKTKRARHVPVPGPVWDRLKAELPDDPNALVFPRQRGGLLPIEEYRRAFDKACAQVGIEGLVPHGLRHTTASLAISAGANVKVVQRMLGHATAAMTLDLYGHLLDDDLTGVADALGKAIESTAVSLRYPEPESKSNKLLETAS